MAQVTLLDEPSCGLAAQHHIFTERADRLLHPTIATYLGPKHEFVITDIGCGNGIWAIEVAEKYPSAEVIGINISDAQFPPQCVSPRNCLFRRFDIMNPVAEEYVSRLDVVNIRLLGGPLAERDFSPILENILQMLKPGGWVQWLDISSPPVGAYGTEKLEVKPAWRQPAAITSQLPTIIESVEWLSKLPPFLKRRGFIQIETYDYPPQK